MGKFSRVIMPWKSGADEKHRHKETFILQTSPGLPQSDLDKTIFHPNWRLKAGWEWRESKVRDGHSMFIFYHRDQKPRGMCHGFSEDDLARERSMEFRKEYKHGQVHYVPTKKSAARKDDGFCGSGRWGYR
ncbi:uncharacterized protein N7484_007027 [Penicillium longicatenatum]|uniref:uncharacterized protein n=1 Tax=Penicillium longicatenatum TaxID=1561947 RepID=UPI002546FF9B|nr:uncharacterized protein N7484_007027 [Penicillium longicatenatum]KAJ5639165.1 hypothetical protein N7484_007027 [Penicillium longicatenatum]